MCFGVCTRSRTPRRFSRTADRVEEVSRTIKTHEASGEYTGVIKMTAEGASRFLQFYDELHAELGDEQDIADGRPFRMAYVILLLDRMIRDWSPGSLRRRTR